ncbi:hypothetical protein BCR42DRAFT_442612 [Absidia repens]|uniref:Membrane anchor Opy2 N-terminal domain-containing protein n=1 Tax=Absidia repens TaxID=90262 RepID=A0A1X2I2B8_9FUNG|nr:hypothetical protein BCR42DRAFT_442612 [Absidia repens]
MSNCGQCPPSKCMSRSALGISSPPDNNSSHKTTDDGNEQQGGENNSSLIGGLVGGLVGGGLLIGGLALCIHRSRRNITRALPFQSSVQQHHQQQQQQQSSSFMNNKFVIYPSLSDVPQAMLEHTRNSTSHSIASGVIPITYIPPSHQIQQSINSLPNSNATTAIENPFQDPHHSPYAVKINTTSSSSSKKDDDNDDDDDMSSRHHSVISADVYPSHHAIQMTRAKPQILRVSSLRRNGSAPTLSTKPSHEVHGTKWMRGNSTIELATTTTGTKSGEDQENPFQSNLSTDDADDDLPGSSRPSMNQSLGSTLGDGEITIFWHGQQHQQH